MSKPSNRSVEKIRILLADDHNIVRAGVRQLLESAEDLQVVAEAGDGQEAQTLIELHRPAVPTPETNTSYGMGWFVGPVNGLPAVF